MTQRQSSRNQGTKWLKPQRILLQIGLLLAVVFWLLYEIKHPQEEKSAFIFEQHKGSDPSEEDSAWILKRGRKENNGGRNRISYPKEKQEVKSTQENFVDPESVERIDEFVELDQEREDEEAERGKDYTYEEDDDSLDLGLLPNHNRHENDKNKTDSVEQIHANKTEKIFDPDWSQRIDAIE